MCGTTTFNLKIPCDISIFSLPYLHPLGTTDLFIVLIVFSRMPYIWTVWYTTFSYWLLSLRNMHFSFLHVLIAHLSSVLDAFHCLGVIQYVTHSPAAGHLGCFWVLTIRNTAAINIYKRAWCGHTFSSSGEC